MIPTAYYTLNGAATDVTGHGHDGTPTNVSWVAGVIGQAASLNGSPSRIALPDGVQTALNGQSAATVSCRIKRASVGSLQNIFYFTTTSYSARFRARFEANNSISVGGRSRASDPFQAVTTTSTFSDTTTWHYLACVIDLAANQIKVFWDGVQLATTGSVIFGQTTFSSTIGAAATIGCTSDYYYYFSGNIDDVRIYPAALPAPWIKALADDRSGRLVPWQPKVFCPVRQILLPAGMAA